MRALIRQHRIRVLLYNSQAVSPITSQLRCRGAERRNSASSPCARRSHPAGPSSSGNSNRPVRSQPRSHDERRHRGPARAPVRRANALRGSELRARGGRAARRARAERDREDLSDPDPARIARAERRARRDRGLPTAGALPPHRLRAAAARLRPRPRPARPRPRPVRARRPPLGLRPARGAAHRSGRLRARRGRRDRLRRRAGRPAVRRRAAAAASRAGARRRPGAAARRRTAPLPRPRATSRRRRPARRAPAQRGDTGRLRHPRRQPGSARSVDRVLYLARRNSWAIGTPDEVHDHARRSRASTARRSTCCACAAASSSSGRRTTSTSTTWRTATDVHGSCSPSTSCTPRSGPARSSPSSPARSASSS